MTTYRRFLLTLSALGILTSAPVRAGSLSLVYDASTLVGGPGQTITVRGTVTNLEAVAVDLNGCVLNLNTFTNDGCAIFFSLTGAPLSLGIGESATFDFFQLTIDSPYLGANGLQPVGSTYTIQGATEPDPGGPSLNTLVEAPFQITVTPEPGTAVLLCLGLPVALAVRRRLGTGRPS